MSVSRLTASVVPSPTRLPNPSALPRSGRLASAAKRSRVRSRSSSSSVRIASRSKSSLGFAISLVYPHQASSSRAQSRRSQAIPNGRRGLQSAGRELGGPSVADNFPPEHETHGSRFPRSRRSLRDRWDGPAPRVDAAGRAVMAWTAQAGASAPSRARSTTERWGCRRASCSVIAPRSISSWMRLSFRVRRRRHPPRGWGSTTPSRRDGHDAHHGRAGQRRHISDRKRRRLAHPSAERGSVSGVPALMMHTEVLSEVGWRENNEDAAFASPRLVAVAFSTAASWNRASCQRWTSPAQRQHTTQRPPTASRATNGALPPGDRCPCPLPGGENRLSGWAGSQDMRRLQVLPQCPRQDSNLRPTA